MLVVLPVPVRRFGAVTVPISAAATQSLSIGQTASARSIVSAASASSLSIGQAATVLTLPATSVAATATQSLSIGQTATVQVLPSFDGILAIDGPIFPQVPPLAVIYIEG